MQSKKWINEFTAHNNNSQFILYHGALSMMGFIIKLAYLTALLSYIFLSVIYSCTKSRPRLDTVILDREVL